MVCAAADAGAAQWSTGYGQGFRQFQATQCYSYGPKVALPTPTRYRQGGRGEGSKTSAQLTVHKALLLSCTLCTAASQ